MAGVHIPSGLAIIAAVVGCAAAAAAEPDAKVQPVDYVTQIKPLLAKHCYACHSATKQQSGLRLDTARLAATGGDRGAAIVPGESGKSRLYLALLGQDDITRMPLDAPTLKPAEIALVKRWIDEGARAPRDEQAARAQKTSDHWSFQPIVRPELPEVKQADWPRQPLDYFVLARLEQEGLRPSPAADRPTLIRRVSLDLQGLPPSLDEVDQYLADRRPGAYGRMVDRMLDSPHYGERWGRHWLDLARYADSNGFTIDGPRSIWKYRDWVIDAINAGMPFDQFTIEQMAGDLLPDPTRAQLVATGFHRNTLVNQEGGTDPEQFRVEAVVDRVATTGSVFLGLTIGCAQCHDHKFDPISQREFYQMYAFLNQTEDVKSVRPLLVLSTPEQAERQRQLRVEIAKREKALKAHDAELAARRSQWEQKIAAAPARRWRVLDPARFTSQSGAAILELDDKSLIVGVKGNVPANDTYTVTADVPFGGVTAIRLEVLTSSDLPQGGPGLAGNGNFVLSEFTASARPLQPNAAQQGTAAPQPVAFSKAVADWSQKDFPVANAIDGDPRTGWAINVGKNQGSANVDREAIFVLTDPLELSTVVRRLTFTMKHASQSAKYLIGRFRLSVCHPLPGDEIVPAAVARSAAVAADKRSAAQKAMLDAAYLATDTERRSLVEKLDELKEQERELTKAIPTTMIMRERDKPRETFVMIRGNFLHKGAAVRPKIPAVLPQLPESIKHPDRLDLARWLVSPDNPLTPRVTVNRYWQRFFGLGLVETENDFGTQGTLPSHPRLLDWLAREFVDSGWDVKAMHRRIVMSATYRQSSHVTPEMQRRDQSNHLLARQSRIRLEAEVIRDACLTASGLLSRKVGGPGVYPPQPDGIRLLSQVSKAWPESRGADRYRRGMYIYFWRSNPYPFLATFDAPKSNNTCTRRARSNTPLQALTLANGAAFFEMAQGMAARILNEGPGDDTGRLLYAFRVSLSRAPTDREFAVLTRFLEQQREHYAASDKAASAAAPAQRPPDVPVSEAAAWTALARVLLNLDEFITRE